MRNLDRDSWIIGGQDGPMRTKAILTGSGGPESPLLTYSEAAEYLRISVGKLKRLVGEGQIVSISIGWRRLFRRPDLDNFIESRQVGA